MHSIPQKSHIAVLIPCFNEALTIKKVVSDFASVLPEADIYVYDNNSSDRTADIAKEAGAIVIHEYRQGKGNVIRSMFRDIEADCYVMVDGDDTYPAEFAREMADLVLEKKRIWSSVIDSPPHTLKRTNVFSIIQEMSLSDASSIPFLARNVRLKMS